MKEETPTSARCRQCRRVRKYYGLPELVCPECYAELKRRREGEEEPLVAAEKETP